MGDQQTSELIVTPTKDNRKPKAVVVVLGWMGSDLRHVLKYSKLYQDRGCTTITGHLNQLAVMIKSDSQTGSFVDQVVQQAATFLRPYYKTENDDENDDGIPPLILHAFSNGGALVIQGFESRLESNKNNHDWELIRKSYRRGASIMDSAPAYLSLRAITNAMSSSIPNPVVKVLGISFMYIFIHVWNLTVLLQGKPSVPVAYWNYWMHAPAHSSIQAFVYSTTDIVTESGKLDELVEIRQKKRAKTQQQRVMSKVFHDTDHVQHYRKHPKEYAFFLEEILDACAST